VATNQRVFVSHNVSGIKGINGEAINGCRLKASSKCDLFCMASPLAKPVPWIPPTSQEVGVKHLKWGVRVWINT